MLSGTGTINTALFYFIHCFTIIFFIYHHHRPCYSTISPTKPSFTLPLSILHVICQILKPYDMPSKVVFFVIEGEGTFTYGDRTETVTPGDMIHVDPGELRFWANNTDKTVRLLVIKSLTEG